MRLFDTLLGRTKPVEANLDKLFGLPGAFVTLEASMGLRPSGEAGVCFKPTAGQPFAATKKEVEELLALPAEDASTAPSESSQALAVPPSRLREEADSYGFHWIVLEESDPDDLVTRAHLINSTLQEHGYGPQLLCSVFGFTPVPGGAADPASGTGARHHQGIYLVYLYKRGSFYPFVVDHGEHRDNDVELQLKLTLAEDLAIEPDLERWFPLWGVPVR
jgi:hypothetical protein